MASLTQTRCFNHAGREAVARCQSCHQFFCRECVTEHDDRMTCSNCLAQQVGDEKKVRRSFAELFGLVQLGLGIVFLWVMFYGIGRSLLTIEDQFHADTLWQQNSWEMDE